MTSTQSLFLVLAWVSWGLGVLEWILAYRFVSASYLIGIPVFRRTIQLEKPPVRHYTGSTIIRPEGRFRFTGSTSVLFTPAFSLRRVPERERPYPLKCTGTLRGLYQVDVVAKLPLGVALFLLCILGLLFASNPDTESMLLWSGLFLGVGVFVGLVGRWRAESLADTLKEILQKSEEPGPDTQWTTDENGLVVDVMAGRSSRRRISPLGVAIIAGLIGVSLVLEGTSPMEREAALQEGSATVVGRVTTATTRTITRRGPSHSIVRTLAYSYSIGVNRLDGSFESVDQSFFSYEQGDTITIRYAVADPSIARPACLDGQSDAWLMVTIGWIVLGIAVAYPVLDRFVLRNRL